MGIPAPPAREAGGSESAPVSSPPMPAPPPYAAYLLLTASMALVGTYVALSKPLVAALPVFALAFLRFAIGAVAMIPWTPRARGEAPLSAPERRWLFLMSFFGNFLFSVCMLTGIGMTTATAAGVILATLPAVVALLSRLVLRERLAPRTLLAIALAVGGIVLLQFAKLAGCHVTVISSSDEKLARAKALGADAGLELAGAGRPRRVEVTVGLLGRRDLGDDPVEIAVELRVGMDHQRIRGAFDRFIDVRIVIALALVLGLQQAAGDGEVVDPPRLLALLEDGRDGDPAVGLDARRPEAVADLDGGERNGRDGVVLFHKLVCREGGKRT